MIPLFLISVLNFNTVRALLGQKQEQKRNLDLTVLFLTSSLVWSATWVIKYIFQQVAISSKLKNTTIIFAFWPYLDLEAITNILDAFLMAPAINSFLNPVIILAVHRNVRKPIAKFFSRLTMKWSR